MPMPDDLVSLRDAATMVERDKRTLRRWVQAGKLERFEGPPPDNGGSGVTLVRRSELLALVASTGQEPRRTLAETPVTPSLAGMDNKGADVPDNGGDVAVELQRLRGELALARLQAELAAIAVERDTLAQRLEASTGRLQDESRRHLDLAADLRAERDEWKDRHDAVRAELDTLRHAMVAREGLPWWRRMLDGPGARGQS